MGRVAELPTLDVITHMAGRVTIEAETTFLPKSEGGRDIPDGIFCDCRYRPHLVVGDPSQRQALIEDGNRLAEEYLGVVFSGGPPHIEPGIPTKTTMILLYPSVDYSAVVPGATFTLREAARIIGYGRIVRRWTEA